jgi:hypothetical protein
MIKEAIGVEKASLPCTVRLAYIHGHDATYLGVAHSPWFETDAQGDGLSCHSWHK